MFQPYIIIIPSWLSSTLWRLWVFQLSTCYYTCILVITQIWRLVSLVNSFLSVWNAYPVAFHIGQGHTNICYGFRITYRTCTGSKSAITHVNVYLFMKVYGIRVWFTLNPSIVSNMFVDRIRYVFFNWENRLIFMLQIIQCWNALLLAPTLLTL